jgi:hypothetical protein
VLQRIDSKESRRPRDVTVGKTPFPSMILHRPPDRANVQWGTRGERKDVKNS